MGVEVKYNGGTVANLSAGEKATLSTANKFMQSDIAIKADEKTTITYNGSTIKTLSAGQTGMVQCSGKVMVGNVVVKVSDAEELYTVSGTYRIDTFGSTAGVFGTELVTFISNGFSFQEASYSGRERILYYGDIPIYDANTKQWLQSDPAYQYITFPSEQQVSQSFYNWLAKYATYVGNNPPSGGEG